MPLIAVKLNYYKKIIDCNDDHKKQFKMIDSLLGRKNQQKTNVPAHSVLPL